MSEEDKGKQREAIEAKYNKMIEDEQKEHSEALNKAQEDAIKKRFESKIAQTEDNLNTGEDPEVAKARLAMEESLALLENAHQMEGESIEQFNERKLALKLDYNKKYKEYSQAVLTYESRELDAIGKVVNSTGDLLEAFGTKSKTLTAASKVLALAQISISTGVAISKGIAAAQAVINGISLGGKLAEMFPIAAIPMQAFGTALGAANAGAIMGTTFAGTFDNGGTIPAGQSGIVSEYGDELVNGVLVKGPARVTSREDTAKMMNGGGGSVSIVIENRIDGASYREERIDENTVRIIAERVFNDNIDSGVSSVHGNRNSRSTKQMKNSFNVKGKV